MELKWGYNRALFREVWVKWAFLLLECRYGAKGLSEAGAALTPGLLKAQREHTRNIFWWSSAFLVRSTNPIMDLSVLCSIPADFCLSFFNQALKAPP